MLDLKTTSIKGSSYYYLSPKKSHQLVFNLAQKINKKIEAGKIEKPEIIVGIARGSLTWIKTLADWLNIENIHTIRIIHYKDVAKRLAKPTLLESCLPKINNTRILVFDNVVETGKTMKLAINYLKIKGAEKIYTSSLFYKKNLICKPDFFNLKTKSWIVFHFDIMETVKFLGSRWLSKNQSLKEIKNNFLKIGLPENEVAKAMQLIFNFS